uniref:superoxide dismutase n=1 Tax=Neobodo designis TaxID=312471 RepID=A0A6U4VHH8_NEODS|mmetsp:Transcript_45786/g.141066  ORF Transcript_45786/g.141066 Transcript_45786/m.141066 type:complete len:297 (+) Transcript_45786:135-1025(+)
MLRRAALTTSAAAVAPLAQQRSIGMHLPKRDVVVGKFDINAEYDTFRERTGKTPDHDMAQYRKLYWRADETVRRAERYIQAQGFFHLPILDFPAYKGCPPLMSGQQLRIHYGRHHRLYVEKLNALLPGTKYEGMNLDDIIRLSAPNNNDDVAVFNNAAQHYNHSFFWKNITPWGCNIPPDFLCAIEEQYGTWEAFVEEFEAKAMGFFGSGWIWLIYDGLAKKFDIVALKNAGCPLTENSQTPLMTLDAWEHAWYVDFENEKAKYVKGYFKVADWHWAERHWKRATGQEYNQMIWDG